MSNILITGGSGFIGRHFHNSLPQQNVVSIDLNKPSFAHKSKFVQGDIRSEKDVQKAIAGNNITTILSLAAKHHDFGIGHDEYFDTNEDGTRILCKVANDYGIKEIIFFSSVAVYGLQNTVSTEATSTAPDSPYGASKLAGEKVLTQWANEDPSRKLLILRPTLVFGPHNKANMFNLIRQVDSGFYFHLGASDNIKSIAYVENVVDATLFLKDNIKPGINIYNYADEPQLTARQITNVIAGSLQKRIRFTIPKSIGILFGLPFDLIIKLTGKNLPISTARIKKLGTQTHHSAKEIFSQGFKPRYSSIDGLKKMVDWYRFAKEAQN